MWTIFCVNNHGDYGDDIGIDNCDCGDDVVINHGDYGDEIGIYYCDFCIYYDDYIGINHCEYVDFLVINYGDIGIHYDDVVGMIYGSSWDDLGFEGNNDMKGLKKETNEVYG